MDIAVWLRGLGLERYELAFRDNEIDRETLAKLTAEDLKDLGVVLGSHRRKLLAAIATLKGNAAPAIQRASAARAVERRQLTVMFCDLVGSSELASRLDPEDLREVIAGYQRAVADVIAGFDGFIAKYMGDGVFRDHVRRRSHPQYLPARHALSGPAGDPAEPAAHRRAAASWNLPRQRRFCLPLDPTSRSSRSRSSRNYR